MLFHLISQYGYAALFSLLLLGILGLPVPDEVLMTFSGYLAYKGELSIAPVMAVAFLGSICGITISYSIGRTVASFLVRKYGKWVHITPQKIEQVHAWLERTGKWGLSFGYFIPGFRHLVAMVAGISQLNYGIFAAFAYPGGLLWSSSFVTAGFFLGREWPKISTTLHRWVLIASLVILSVFLLFWYFQKRTSKEKSG